MKTFFAIIVLLHSRVHLTQQSQVCEDIRNGNGEHYSLAEINQCAEEEENRSNRLLSEVSCPEWDCPNTNCRFGYAKNEHGCFTCDCASEGTEGLFEADIVLNDKIRRYLRRNMVSAIRERPKRGASRQIPLWDLYRDGNSYVVPYVIQSSIVGSGRQAIQAAIADFEKNTCIKLRPRTSQRYYVSFYRGSGCSSPVGRTGNGGVNEVSLGNGCWAKGTVIHEVLHSLGFWHEQSRPDRDGYVTIQWNNIQRGLSYNFNKLSTDQIDSRNSPYDIGSVMHYSSSAFSINGRPTITDKRGNRLVTQRNGFAQTDIDQLNLMYGCAKTGSGRTTTTTRRTPTTTRRTTKTTTTGSCTNSNTNCAYWARIGECQRNPAYMLTSCCRSCSRGTTSTRQTTTTRRTTTTAGSCTNSNTNCAYWARIGECQRNPAYMRTSCCRSCSTTSSCKDKSNFCITWKNAGYCNNSMYMAYMRQNCAASCRQCPNTGK